MVAHRSLPPRTIDRLPATGLVLARTSNAVDSPGLPARCTARERRFVGRLNLPQILQTSFVVGAGHRAFDEVAEVVGG